MAATPRWTVPALAVAIAALLVAGIVGAVTTGDDEDGDSASATTAAPATTAGGAVSSAPATTAPSAITALVPELQEFVSRERGLPFRTPVEVELLDDESFERRLLEDAEDDEQELAEVHRVLRALDLVDGDIDLQEALETLLSGLVAGFYDAETKELVVRGAEPTPYVRSVLVHELTHALQDQHFQLHRPELDERDDESGLGFAGVVEGDAVRIQDAYLRSLPSGERRQASEEEASYGEGIDDVPEVLLIMLSFPYATGPDLVQAILQAGGQPRLDASFRTPPTTAEHLLHPELYLAGHQPVTVAPPPAEGRVIDQGIFGELALILLFRDDLDPRTAARAAAGWGGDWYVAWDRGDETCVRSTFVMDSPADTAELRDALDDWADEHDGASVEGTGPVTLTSCG